MMPSFDNSKRKIEKIWNQNNTNKIRIGNLTLISFDFNSINFNKRVGKIVLAKDLPVDGDGGIICWVAKEIYGEYDIRVEFAKKYFLFVAPTFMLKLYINYGQKIAKILKRIPILKVCVKPLFDYFCKKGMDYAIQRNIRKLS